MASHPFTWYSIHMGKTGNLRTRGGKKVTNILAHISETVQQLGIKDGSMSLIFENAFPIFGKRIFGGFKFWEARWMLMETLVRRKIDLSAGKRRSVRLVDIGCGSGDLIFAMREYAKQKGINLACVGVDIDPDAIQFANQLKKERKDMGVLFLVGDLLSKSVEWSGTTKSLTSFLNKWGNPDIVVAEGVVEWLDEKEKALDNLLSLGSDSVVVLTTTDTVLDNLLPWILMNIVRLSGSKGHRGIRRDVFDNLAKRLCGKRGYIPHLEMVEVKNLRGSFMVLDAVKKCSNC